MNDRPGQKGPQARQNQLVVRELGDETLVYDLERDTAHCLNRVAADVWKCCNGERSVAEIARLVTNDATSPLDERVIWYALEQLGEDHLLQESVTPPASATGLTRRELLKRVGVTSAVAVPVISSLLAPTTAAHASGGCTPPGGVCNGTVPCCNNLTCKQDPNNPAQNTCQP